MIQIMGIKTKDGFFISQVGKSSPHQGDYLRSTCIPRGWKVNGEHLEPSWHKEWNFVNDIPKTIQEPSRVPDDNFRYELVDPTMEIKLDLPLVYPRDKVAEIDGDYCWNWKPEYANIRSLYDLKWDEHDDDWKDVVFEYQTTYECDTLEKSSFEYTVKGGRWNDKDRILNGSDVKHQILDEIVFPNIVLPRKPCKLTIEQSYDIVRKYVLDNIDGRVASVTSDYDFCFGVTKVIPLSETIKFTVDVNGKINE